MQLKVFRYIALGFMALICACPNGEMGTGAQAPDQWKSICVEPHPLLLPELNESDKKDLFKVLVMPRKFETYVAGFIAEFVNELKARGWQLVDSETGVKSDDTVKDIQEATGDSRVPDIVAFFILRESTLNTWKNLEDQTFTKILLTEDIHAPDDLAATRRFVKMADFVFARYPEAFTNAIAPERCFCTPFYHGAGAQFFVENEVERAPNVLLSGAISGSYYPLRNAANELMASGNQGIVQLVHPGYSFEVDVKEMAAKYPFQISRHQMAIAGAVFSETGPYLIAKHFEIPATGTVMLTDKRVAGLLQKLGFVAGEHYIAVEPAELESTIAYWLAPERSQALKEMARKGKELVSSLHRISHRADKFDDVSRRVHKLTKNEKLN